MRFLITALVFGLAAVAQAGGHEREEHGKGKHGKKKKLKFQYEWRLTVTDENLGRDTEDDADFKVRAIKNSLIDAEVDYRKEWDGIKASIDYNLIEGLESAYVRAELPRSYLSVDVGKGLLHAGGWQEYYSPYLDYHHPFPFYAPMMRVFAPMEGVGELSLMITSDVKEGEEDKRWHNDDDAIIGMLQYKGEFGVVSPLLQFAMYDFKAGGDDDDGTGWQSWVLTAGLKFALDNLKVHLDYIHDSRKNKDADEEQDLNNTTTVYRNYTAGVSFEHGIIAPWASISMLMSANDDDRYNGVEGNFMPPGEGSEDDDEDNHTDYEKLVQATFNDHKEGYEKLEGYQKFGSNMMIFNAGVEIKCVDDRFIPYLSYKMKMHRIDPNWQEEDSDLEDQISHSIAFGVYGTI